MNNEQKKQAGYSKNITDSAFSRNEAPKKGGNLAYFQVLIPAVLIAILWMGGIVPPAVCVLLAIICAALTLPPILRKQRTAADHTYDGEIVSIERREPASRADARKIGEATRAKMVFHTLRIKADDGGMHVYERTGYLFEDYRTYYRPGDRVRHHKGFDLPEKYDKTGDEKALCIVCGRTGSIDSRRCGECGAKLLK